MPSNAKNTGSDLSDRYEIQYMTYMLSWNLWYWWQVSKSYVCMLLHIVMIALFRCSTLPSVSNTCLRPSEMRNMIRRFKLSGRSDTFRTKTATDSISKSDSRMWKADETQDGSFLHVLVPISYYQMVLHVTACIVKLCMLHVTFGLVHSNPRSAAPLTSPDEGDIWSPHLSSLREWLSLRAVEAPRTHPGPYPRPWRGY